MKPADLNALRRQSRARLVRLAAYAKASGWHSMHTWALSHILDISLELVDDEQNLPFSWGSP